jgi:hypothetical protein
MLGMPSNVTRSQRAARSTRIYRECRLSTDAPVTSGVACHALSGVIWLPFADRTRQHVLLVERQARRVSPPDELAPPYREGLVSVFFSWQTVAPMLTRNDSPTWSKSSARGRLVILRPWPHSKPSPAPPATKWRKPANSTTRPSGKSRDSKHSTVVQRAVRLAARSTNRLIVTLHLRLTSFSYPTVRFRLSPAYAKG